MLVKLAEYNQLIEELQSVYDRYVRPIKKAKLQLIDKDIELSGLLCDPDLNLGGFYSPTRVSKQALFKLDKETGELVPTMEDQLKKNDFFLTEEEETKQAAKGPKDPFDLQVLRYQLEKAKFRAAQQQQADQLKLRQQELAYRQALEAQKAQEKLQQELARKEEKAQEERERQEEEQRKAEEQALKEFQEWGEGVSRSIASQVGQLARNVEEYQPKETPETLKEKLLGHLTAAKTLNAFDVARSFGFVAKLIASNPVLASYPPQDVYRAYEWLFKLAPAVMRNEIGAKEMLIKYLEQGGRLDNYDLKLLMDIERRLHGRLTFDEI